VTSKIHLTPAKRDHVEWAFGAMFDYWGAACEPGAAPDPAAEGVTENELEVPEGATMPYLDGDTLVLSTWAEINDDLAQRIGQQLPDMADNAACVGGGLSPQRAASVVRSAHDLAASIREAMVSA
jgi:hypothetical protein